jgi:hypothetical protein
LLAHKDSVAVDFNGREALLLQVAHRPVRRGSDRHRRQRNGLAPAVPALTIDRRADEMNRN